MFLLLLLGAAALETLQKHDVVSIKEGEGYRFTVPLMRRWVREHKRADASDYAG